MSFLSEPPETSASRRLYEADLEAAGYVGNLTRVWAWRPDVWDAFTALRELVSESSALDQADWAVLGAATASARGDAYGSLGSACRLAAFIDDETAAEVLRGGTGGLSEKQRVLAEWARQVVGDPNAATETQVETLRSAGLDDQAIFEVTTFIALRLASSTVNDALGAPPDLQLAQDVGDVVRQAVQFGRTPA